MKVKISKKFFIVFPIFAFLVFILILNNLNSPYREPKTFVVNRTTEKKSDLLFNYEITKYPSNVEIVDLKSKNDSNTVGISADIWNLNFGIIPLGGSWGQRSFILRNKGKVESRVDLTTFGNISDMVSFEENNFLLTDENKTVNVFLNTTSDTIPGNYTGEIDVIIKIKKF